MRVATYNVRHCRGRDGVVDPLRTARVVESLGADLVALQELDRGKNRSGGGDQPAILSERAGLEVFFHPTIADAEGSYGIALAAPREPPVEVHRLPRLGDEEPRAALVARLEWITAIATHLSRRRSARRKQIGYLAGLVEQIEGPVVLLGDLNQAPDALGVLEAAGLAAAEAPPTYPSHRPRHRIDHVLAGRGALVAATEAVASDASDHLPLVATIHLV